MYMNINTNIDADTFRAKISDLSDIYTLKYVYDGSFDGLLTAIYESCYRRQNPEQMVAYQDLQEDMFSQVVYIETDRVKAEKVYQSINNKISSDALMHVFYVYLSDLEEAGILIYRYLQLGWKVGKNIARYLADDRVIRVHDISRKVGGESHRMLGLIRFRCLKNQLYYAPIEPDHNIVGLVAPHFAERLADQHWMIHDLRRNIAAIYNRCEWVMTELNEEQFPFAADKITDGEEIYQTLWRQYCSSIVISSRINPRLQKRNMPMRYWKYLTEKT